jgi:hypothetical protein
VHLICGGKDRAPALGPVVGFSIERVEFFHELLTPTIKLPSGSHRQVCRPP